MKKTNSIRLTKQGKERIQHLLNSFMVDQYHKILLKGIESRIGNNNLSKSDCEIFETISKEYGDSLWK